MNEARPFPAERFDQAGLNRQHVFALDALPASVMAALGDTGNYRQLILLGHAGRRLWECIKAADMPGDHPIDDYTVRTVEGIFAEHLADRSYRIVYPGDTPVGLQQLGKLAGWHQASPFMLGIDSEWGSWFAYRAAILADTEFSPFLPVDRSNPCLSCSGRPCVTACPAGAMDDGEFSLARCAGYRVQSGSACADTCLARLACPAGREHRYEDAQIRHSYAQSLTMIRQYRDTLAS